MRCPVFIEREKYARFFQYIEIAVDQIIGIYYALKKSISSPKHVSIPFYNTMSIKFQFLQF